MNKPITITLQVQVDPVSEEVMAGAELAQTYWVKKCEDRRDTACERAAKGLTDELMSIALEVPPAALAAHLYGAFKLLLDRSVQAAGCAA